jgi:hypothetical protein
MILTRKDAEYYAKKYKIDTKKISISTLLFGMKVELEHGSKMSKMTNVTKNSKSKTFKIALAHLMEYPDYYQRLKRMESKAEKYWKNKDTNIFLDN